MSWAAMVLYYAKPINGTGLDGVDVFTSLPSESHQLMVSHLQDLNLAPSDHESSVLLFPMMA